MPIIFTLKQIKVTFLREDTEKKRIYLRGVSGGEYFLDYNGRPAPAKDAAILTPKDGEFGEVEDGEEKYMNAYTALIQNLRFVVVRAGVCLLGEGESVELYTSETETINISIHEVQEYCDQHGFNLSSVAPQSEF